MRHRLLVPITLAMLYGCTDQPPTGPQIQAGGPGVHLGAFAGANGRIVFVGNGLQTMGADGSNVQSLSMVGAGAPAWSPNGARIAFIASDGNDNEVYVMNADGSGVTQLTFNSTDEQSPSWSADGTRIGYSGNASGAYQIYTINATTGGSPTALTSGADVNFGPSWSPNGAKIAFTSLRDGHQEIYVMNSNGTGQTRLTNTTEWSYDPSWSPDGSKIVFTRGDAIPEIFVMDADGANPTNLTNTPSHAESSAAWSPDGTRIVYIRDVSNLGDVFVMNADGSSQTNITNTAAIAESSPDWQPLSSGGPTVVQQIQALIDYLGQSGFVKGTVNSLRSPLLDAINAVNANNIPQACSLIADFINKTNAQSGKKLNPDVAADLVARAKAIADRLGCGSASSKCYPGLGAPQLVLESTTQLNGIVDFEFNVSNYAIYPNELFAQAPDLPPCGLNTTASRTWVDVYDGNNNYLFGFCAFGQASDLNGVWFATPVDKWPAQAYIKLTDRRCNITYTSNRVNLAGII